MKPLHFEWGKIKAATNRKKHGITFEEAATAFSDANGRIIADQITPKMKIGSFCWV